MGDFVREQREYWKPKLYEGWDVDYLGVFRDKISGSAYDFSRFLNGPMSAEEHLIDLVLDRLQAHQATH